jgi:transposase-like protein
MSKPRNSRRSFPADAISHAVWLYCFVPSPQMAEDTLAARLIVVSHEAARNWADKLRS